LIFVRLGAFILLTLPILFFVEKKMLTLSDACDKTNCFKQVVNGYVVENFSFKKMTASVVVIIHDATAIRCGYGV